MKNLKRNSFIILIVTLFVLFLVLKDDYKNIISKYVRMKNGKLEEHFDRGE